MALAAGLLGCATPPMLPEAGMEFRVAGRVGLIAERRAVSANYVWRQYVDGVEIELWGPLGQGRTRVVADGASLTVHAADGTRLEDAEAQALVRREFGLAAPLDLLSHWIRGRPAPEWPVDASGEGSRDDSFSQLGWHVVPSRFLEVSGRRVPGRLVATRGDRRLTVLCREWDFGRRN